jgi:PAS domain S-box-containing protein
MEDKSKQKAAILRQKAEELLKNEAAITGNAPSELDILKLVHELDLHQVELEMQNEELLLATKKAQSDAEKYQELYDFAPSGYFTLSKEGLIIEVNLRGAELLSRERIFLIKSNFSHFISDETRPTFNLFLESLFNNKTKQGCEVLIRLNKDAITYDVYLTGVASENGEQCYITMLDISKLKRAEAEIIEKEKKYRTLFDTNRDSVTVFRIGPDGKPGNFIVANKATTEIFGYSNEELLKMTVKKLEPASIKKRKERIAILLSKKSLDFETIIKTKKGNKRNVEVETLIINYENEPAVMNITRDVTDRKQMEANSRKAQENLLTILEAIPDLLFEVDSTGKIYHYQSPQDNLLAVPPSEFMGKSFSEVLPSKVNTIIMEALQEANKNGRSSGKQYALELPQGKYWFELSVSLIKESITKDKHFIVLARDITERKLAELALTNEKRRLAVILIGTGAGTWEWNIQTGETIFNEQWANIIGYTLEELAPVSIDTWEKYTHPDDLKHSGEILEKHFKGELDYYECEARMKHKNGDWIWVLDRGKINEWDLDGKPLLMSGTHLEITERKLAETSLRESEEKYRSLVENSPDGVIIYKEGKIVFANEEAKHMVGAKTKNKLIGKPVLQFIHPDSQESVVRKMEELLSDKNSSQLVEEKFIRLDGTPFDVELKAIPTVYEHKNAIQVIVHDITQRKKSALELTKINRVYALISQINNLIIRTHNQEELFQEICNIAVNFGKFRMSWIGLITDDKRIITEAFAGYESGYFTKSNITTINDEPEGRGPTGIATREARTVICNDISNEEMMKPWRKDALERGYNSLISIPLMVRNKIIGAFNLYSEEKNFFSSEEEITLLEKIILNISFALEKIQVEEDRKKTEDKIRQLSQAVEQSPVSIVITNTFGKIEYVNQKFIETTKYTLEEAIGQNPRFLKSGYTSQGEYKELWQTIVGGKEWHGEFHNKRKDGTLFWESASISPIVNTEGKTTHFIAIKEDITDRKNVEKELVKSKERAEESDRLKLVFLANMSHEIRTPMNGILGFTELLKAPHISSEEQQEYISIIEKSGKRMLNIINDIISISKVESGQIEVSKDETNINEQLEYIYTFFKPEANLKGIDLTLQKLLSSKNNYIKTDREKLYAVLTNLVKNAIKFTNEGSIEIGCEKKGGYLEFFVKDTGLGIPISQKKIIFERFRQANETISRTHEGSGLGLAISKAYVEMLDGRIWVESQEGKGSTFYFTIPFHSDIDHKNDIVVDKAVSIIKEENKVKDLKVLIVEDDAISKLLITIAVKPYSKEILKVSTGFEAIEACKNNPDIDVVMMDINMPEMGGYEATKNIREFNKDLVIIAQTANGMQSDRDNAIAAGCTDYISKPINITSLGELIQMYFKK